MNKQTGEGRNWPYEKRNLTAGVWHGTLFKFGSAFSQENSILPSFIFSLTGSQVLVGLLSTVQRIGTVAPQIFLAHFLSRRPCKKKYLVTAIYTRSLSWFFMGLMVWFLADTYPELTTFLAFAFLLVFFTAGSLGQLVYSYMLSSTISPPRRGRFFGWINFSGGLAGIFAGYLSGKILAAGPEGLLHTYGLLFLITAAGLAMAGLGFVFMKEERPADFKPAPAFGTYFKNTLSIVKENSVYRKVLVVSFLNASVFLILPFFVVLARHQLHASQADIGFYVMMQVTGEMTGGIVWGLIADRYGYRKVLMGVAAVFTLLPVYAVLSALHFPFLYLLSFFFTGSALKSAENGVRNYLLEMTQAQNVPTFIALKNTVTSPTLLYPVLGGVLIGVFGYFQIFLFVAFLSMAGLMMAVRLPEPRSAV